MGLARRLVAGVFDPGDYAAWFDSPLGRRAWADERNALERVLGDVSRLEIVDVGAGDLRFATDLALAGGRVTAVDVSRDMLLAGGRRVAVSGALPVLADAARLPFADATFDVAAAVTLLCFVERPEAIVGEMARVIRPGGLVVLGELARWSVWTAARKLRAWLRGGVWATARFWTLGELRSLLRASGLTPSGQAAAVYYPPGVSGAWLLDTLENRLGRLSHFGAAFIAVAGRRA